MERILVSACLLGVNCKYNGGNNYNKELDDYLKDKNIIIVCPEIMGGLGIPRVPSEIKDNKVISKDRKDVTTYFYRGAEEVLELVKKYNIKKAILKSKSPSCGCGEIYDGSFTNTLVEGNGVTTQLLIKNGVEVKTEKNFSS